jgi:hypothetical protein
MVNTALLVDRGHPNAEEKTRAGRWLMAVLVLGLLGLVASERYSPVRSHCKTHAATFTPRGIQMQNAETTP